MGEVCENGQLTAADIARLVANIDGVNNWAEGGPADGGIMANGQSVPSPMKVITDSKMFKDAIAWTATTLVTDSLQTYTNGGIVYAPQPSLLPFTTGATFTASNWYVLQGLLVSDLGDLSIRSFPTMAALIAEVGTADGDLVRTEVFHSTSVGGGGLYRIGTGIDFADGGRVIDLDNGRQAQLIQEDFIRASQYGAIGDGSTDDSTVLQAMFDHGSNSHIIMDTNSNLGLAGISLVGRSGLFVDITASLTALSTEFIYFDGVINSIIQFSGEGSMTHASYLTSRGIVLDDCDHVTIFNPMLFTFSGASFSGIGIYILNGSTYCKVIGGLISNGGTGIVIEDTTTLSNTIDNVTLINNDYGLKILGSSYNTITNLICNEANHAGIFLQDKTGGCLNNRFISCACNNGTGAADTDGGVVVQAAVAVAVPSDNIFIGQVCNNNAAHGINFKAVVDTLGNISGFNFIFNSPICKNNTLSGIRLERAYNSQITDALCKDNTVNGLTTEDCQDLQNNNGSYNSNSVDGINHKSIRTTDIGCSCLSNGRYGLIISDGVETSVLHTVMNCDINNNISDDLLPSGTAGGNLKAVGGRGVVTDNRGVTSAQNNTAISHGLTPPTGYTLADMIIIAMPTTDGAIVSITSKTSTTFIIALVDDTGAAITTNENINWAAHLY